MSNIAKRMVFNVLCSNRVHMSMPIHLMYKKFHAFGGVAHCFCNPKRCCKACNCAYMAIWITTCKGWKMRKMWPFKVGRVKITKKISCTLGKCRKILAPTYEQLVSCESMHNTYPHHHDGWFTKWIKSFVTTFTSMFNDKKNLNKGAILFSYNPLLFPYY